MNKAMARIGNGTGWFLQWLYGASMTLAPLEVWLSLGMAPLGWAWIGLASG
jgi:hypothetical protein